MDVLHTFLPIDRLQALAGGNQLPDHAEGSVLFADVPGFTPLTESLAQVFGPQRGAEELTNQLNRVYTALIGPVHRYHGSVISFSGDSINCWFDGDDGRRAAAAGWAMQAAVAQLEPFQSTGGLTFQPSIKVAIAVGPVRRFLAGDPAIQRMDVLTGSTLEVLEQVGRLVKRGMVVMEAAAARALAASGAGFIFNGEREDPESGIRAAVLAGQSQPVPPNPWPQWSGQADEQKLNAVFRASEAWLLPAVQQRLRAGAERFLGDLRPVAVLFLNFGGLDYNDDEAELLLDAYLRKVQDCLVRYEGAPLQLNTGDKGNYLYAAFGAPLAHDDDAARAVTAALELLQISQAMGFITGARVGIAQGVMFAGAYGSPSRQTFGLIGDKVNVAARLMQLAKPGEVLCDQEVYTQARRYWGFQTLPMVQLKGKAAPIPVYRPLARLPKIVETVGDQPQQADRLAPLVGRQPEIEQLNTLLDSLQSGKSGVVFVEGEAGIGKSRLLAALITMAKNRGVPVLSGSGQSIEQTVPYRAWRDVFQAYFDIAESDSLSTRQEKAQRAVEVAVPRMLRRLPLLNEVLNLGLPETQLTSALDPKLRRESLFNLLVALLSVRLQAGPLVLVLEDAHWMDALSWELAQTLFRVMLLEQKPILLALVTRPLEEAQPGIKTYLDLRGHPACSAISLEALDKEALAALIAGQLGVPAGHLPPQVFRFVQARSDGNPFFAEELVQTMRDRGMILLEPGEDGLRCRANADLEQAAQALPGTLQGLILSRIDRLPPEQQLTIKVAAVIGHTFTYSPLRDTLSQFAVIGDDDLKGHLSELVRRELTLLEVPEPELTYVFKHVITQEAAYQSLLYAQRKEIHLAVARLYEGVLQADETLSPGLLPLLAYHYRQAEQVEQERRYARKAGEAAAQAYANDSALAYFTRALELTPVGDLEIIFELHKKRLKIYELQGNQSAILDEITRLSEIAEQLDAEKQAYILHQRSRFYTNQGQYERAEADARRSIALAGQLQDIEPLIDGQVELSLVLFRRARYSEAAQELEPALDLARASGLRESEARVLHQLGVIANLLGNRPQSFDYFQQSLQAYRIISHRYGEGLALNNLGIAYWNQGNLRAAREHLEQSLAIMREVGARSGEVYPLSNLGAILYDQRRYDEAIIYNQQALALARELNQPYSETRSQGNLGNAYLATGNFAQALSSYQESLATAQASGDRDEEAREMENIAWCCIRLGDLSTADLYIEKALQCCQEYSILETEADVEKDRATRELWLGNLDQAQSHCARALDIAQQIGMTFGRETYFLLLGEVYLRRNLIDQAEDACQEARKIYDEIGKPGIEAQAKLIRVNLARGDTVQAAARAGEILAFLENDTVTDAQDPAEIYLACFQAMQAAGDARCAEILAQGYRFLQSLAGQLTGEQRQMYLENVPSNKALLALWAENQTWSNG